MLQDVSKRLDDFSADKALEINSVFADGKVLTENYVPRHFLFRKDEMSEIGVNLSRIFREMKPEDLILVGPPGTGKTHIARRMGDTLTEKLAKTGKSIIVLYQQCRSKTFCEAISSLAHQINDHFPVKGFSSSMAQRELIKHLNGGTKYLFIFDEVDRMIPTTSYPHPVDCLMSTMSRLDEELGRSAFVPPFISIANKDIRRRLPDATRSKYLPLLIYFRDYNANEILEILRTRADLAFKDGCIDNPPLSYLSSKVRQMGKDLRFAFQVLRTAGAIVDIKGQSAITEGVISESITMTERDAIRATIQQLDDTQMVVLQSIISILQQGKKAMSKNVYHAYKKNCDDSPLSANHIFQKICPRLERQGLIQEEVVGLGRGKGKSLIFDIGDDIGLVSRFCSEELEERRRK